MFNWAEGLTNSPPYVHGRKPGDEGPEYSDKFILRMTYINENFTLCFNSACDFGIWKEPWLDGKHIAD